jgi:hypothetical protein
MVFGDEDNISLRFAAPGDANIDGVFNSGDLVHVFQVGEYEDAIAGKLDMVRRGLDERQRVRHERSDCCLPAGKYEHAGAATSSVPEPTGLELTLLGAIVLIGRRQCHF